MTLQTGMMLLAAKMPLDMMISKMSEGMVETLKIYLNNLSNRDLIKFDEKYIKLIFYCIAMNMNIYSTKSEITQTYC